MQGHLSSLRPASAPVAALVLVAIACRCEAATSVAFAKAKVAGVYVNLVTVDLNDADIRITPAIAQHGIGTSESFRSMLRRTRPAAAINGTFFCTRSLKPTGDIVIDGQLLARGSVGTVVGFGPRGKVSFLPARRDLYNWCDFERVMVAGPALLLRGKTIVLPRAQGFRSRVHRTPQRRAAIGITPHNKLLLVTTGHRVYLRDLARVMRVLKCTDAADLDGGSSIGLYWKGKLLANPTRGLTNCLLVYDNPKSYQARRNLFYPVERYSTAPVNKS